jgi:hypothetical protein
MHEGTFRLKTHNAPLFLVDLAARNIFFRELTKTKVIVSVTVGGVVNSLPSKPTGKGDEFAVSLCFPF